MFKLSRPNIRLHLTLKESLLSKSMCEDLEQKLELNYDLSKTKHDIAEKYHRYRWDLKVKQLERFRTLLSKYQKDNPDVDIFSEDISHTMTTIRYAISIAVTASVTYAVDNIITLLST